MKSYAGKAVLANMLAGAMALTVAQPAASGVRSGDVHLPTLRQNASLTGVDFELCNDTGEDIKVAFGGQASPAAPLQFSGWIAVAKGACASLGTFAPGRVFVHALSETGVRFGRHKYRCVEEGDFSYAYDGGTCNGAKVKFSEVDVKGDRTTYRFPD